MKILGMGNALVDIMTQLEDDRFLERFKLPKGSMTLVDRELSSFIHVETTGLKKIQSSGGSAANTIHGLAHMGLQTTYIGKIGNDEMGSFFKKDMEMNGINPILYNSFNDTGRAVALISRDYERTFATYLGAAVELSVEDITTDIFSGHDLFYIEGYLINNLKLFKKALRIAKKEGLKTAVDLASYNVVKEFKKPFQSILNELVDIVFANEDEARALTGKDPENAINELAEHSEIAIVKTGSDGSLVRSNSITWSVPALEIHPLDTTGAGDLYASGFLYGLSRKLNLQRCAKIGTLLAANVIEIVGAKMDEPRWKNILKEVKLIENEI